MRKFLFPALAAVALASHSQASILLENYQLAFSFDLPDSAAEASAITINQTTGRLYVVGDEGKAIVELTPAGQVISTMTLSGFSDTEGLAYVDGSRFLITEEKSQTAYLLNYSADATVERKGQLSYVFGSDAGNSGLEGITYDPVSGLVFGVKEKNPEEVYEATLDFYNGAADISYAFDPSSLGLADIADIFALGNVSATVGAANESHLLLLSQQSNRLIEVSRTGEILSSLDLSFLGVTNIEGVAMDSDGRIYLASETPQVFVLQAVPEPSTTCLLAIAAAGVCLFNAQTITQKVSRHARRRRRPRA